MSTALSVLVDSTMITFVFALAALGLAVVFGLIGVINMGHGAMLTLGAYFTWFATTHNVPFVPAVLLAGCGVGIIGLALEHFIVRHFYDQPFETLLLTWGFFLISTEIVKIVFGTDLRTVENPLPGAIELGTLVLPAYRSVVALPETSMALPPLAGASPPSVALSRSTSTNTTACFRIQRFADRRLTRCTSEQETQCRPI